MKKVSLILLTVALGIFQACNSDNNDSVDAANEANENKDSSAVTTNGDTARIAAVPVDEDDAEFAVAAANGGMMEVELGKYASQNAMSQRVKDFAAMIVRDHTAANDELKALAMSKNITLPATVGDDARKHMDEMMKMKGKDFDKHYMDMMLDDHKKDVKAFEKAAKDCKDPELKSFAGKTLPVLMAHLDSSKAINGKK